MKSLSFFLLNLLLGLSTYAQHNVNIYSERMFYGGMEIGMNFSTVNGDLRTGYSHLGLNIGPKVYWKFMRDKPLMGSLGLMYNERGAKTVQRSGSSIGDYLETYKIDVNYVQLPIGLHYLYNERYMFTVGASFNYLVSNKESLIDPFGQSIFTGDPRLQFENYFFDARLGVGYLFGKSWKVSGLFEYGLSPIRLYKNTFGPPLADNNQYSALYQFNLTYFF